MRSSRPMRGSFIPASHLNNSHRKLRPRRVQQIINNQRQKAFAAFNKTRFQLFNSTTQTWAIQIDNAPILLIEQDIKKWLSFKVDQLKQNQLYLWHATKFDWIPLWACENEFLLLNLNKLKYDKVNYVQFTKANWIRDNSVSPNAIKILLTKFKIPKEMVDQMQPIINTTIHDGQVAATGQPYFVDRYDTSNNKIPWYNLHRYGWDTNQWFDHRDGVFNYNFIKNFRQTFHYSAQPQNASQVSTFREAMENVPDGCYIYHEKEVYVPYKLHHGHVTFNRGDAIEISKIKQRLNQNRHINTNKYNKLVWNQYNKLWSYQKSIFIDPYDGSYRREFFVHFNRIIPKRF